MLHVESVHPYYSAVGSAYSLSMLFLPAFRDPDVLSPARMDSSSMVTTASPVTASVLPALVPSPTPPPLVVVLLFGCSHVSCSYRYISRM